MQQETGLWSILETLGVNTAKEKLQQKMLLLKNFQVDYQILDMRARLRLSEGLLGHFHTAVNQRHTGGINNLTKGEYRSSLPLDLGKPLEKASCPLTYKMDIQYCFNNSRRTFDEQHVSQCPERRYTN